MLTEIQRKQLLTIARRTIEEALAGRQFRLAESEIDEVLRRPSGAFVTLRTRQGDLRGCIGSIHPSAPLVEAVSSNAFNAAFRDPRFDPVGEGELGDLEIEVSVMGPIQPVADPEQVVCGRDGLIASRGSRAGLLLPQVATEYSWDRETFLSQTCVKAGLPPNAWRSPECRLESFSAEVFGE